MKKLRITRKNDIVPTKENPDRPLELVLKPNIDLIKQYMPKSKLVKLLLKGKKGAKEAIEEEYTPLHFTFTTGRSALPTVFLYTRTDLDRLRIMLSRINDISKAKKEYKCVNTFPFAPHLAFLASYHALDSLGYTTLHTGGGKGLGTKRIMDAIEKVKPEIVFAIPGYGYHLFRSAAEEKRNFSSIKIVVTGAEKASPEMKKRMVDLLEGMGAKDPEIFSLYAFTEGRGVWTECSTFGCEGYHMCPDMEIIEIVDPKTGEAVGEGEEGEIVITPLDGRGSVVIRYGTGDMARDGLVWDKCPNCGRTVPRLSSDIGRVSNNIELAFTKVKGTFVDLNEFNRIMSNMPEVEEWQAEITKKDNDPHELDELYLNVTPKKGIDFTMVKEKIAFEVHRVTELRPTAIRCCDLENMLQLLGMETEMKEKRIVDRRPKIA